MKSSKSIRQQYGKSERDKRGRRTEKLQKLDRKSSRGMIYENEELRLRTININAEVERGQTDIKRLRKENEQLRREIWTLRDECDRLNKRVKAKFIEHEHGMCGARCSGDNGCACHCNEVGGSKFNSEDSDSCESCCCHEEDDVVCNDECCSENKNFPNSHECLPQPTEHEKNNTVVTNTTETPPTDSSKSKNFDHLSVVSEETLSNSEVVSAQQTENLLGYTPGISGSQTTLPSLVGPLTPLTPVELVANELNDLQAVAPPLTYFENILQQHVNKNFVCSTPDSSSTTNSGKTIVKHTNGWDYNLESPFAHRRYQANSVSPIITKRSPAQTLTTFVPTSTLTSSLPTTDISITNEKPLLPKKPPDLSVNSQQNPILESVPITTISLNDIGVQKTEAANNSDSSDNSTPKHFFAPIKPKLKLNTALANRRRLPPPSPSVVNETTTQMQSLKPQDKGEPPDMYMTNALATPYRPPKKPTMRPPPIPQRLTSTSIMQEQVSPSQHQRSRQQHQLHHHRQHQTCRYQHQQYNDNVVVTNNDAYIMPAIYANTTSRTITTEKTSTTTNTATARNLTNNSLCTSMKTNLKTFCTPTRTVLTSNTLCNSLNPLLTIISSSPISLPTIAAATISSAPNTMVYLTPTSPPARFKFINSNINFRKPNDPVYAIAQNVCHNLITSSAVTQPLMSSIVKCCIAKQQQIQQIITAASLSSSPTVQSFCISTAAAIDSGDGGVVTMPPPPSTEAMALSSLTKYSTIACNLTINSSFKKPITTSLTSSTVSTNSIVVDSICQTDSANLESILNDIEAISEDILAIQLVQNKSRDNLNNKSTESVNKTKIKPFHQDNKNAKPYRSEMNLLLTYEDNNPTIKPAESLITTENNSEFINNSSVSRRTRSLERDHTDSPSPNIPDPMQPFPEDRKYIGFDRINKETITTASIIPELSATGTQTSPVLNLPLSHKAQLPLSSLITKISGQKLANGKNFPPTPPIRQYTSPLNVKCGNVPPLESSKNSPILAGVSPNKSQLYAALANAAAKRTQFRSQPSHLTKSLDNDFNMLENKNTNEPNIGKDELEIVDSNRRKTRRVSIVCSDTDSPGTTEKPEPSIRNQLAVESSASGSCINLHSVLQNPALHNIKQTSQSTPNSPHSSRKYEGSPLVTPPVPPIISVTPTSTPQHLQCTNSNINGVSHILAPNNTHSNSYPSVVSPLTQPHQLPRKNSQDTIKASAAEIACAAANAMRLKCSRRHSDGTVSHANHRISGVSSSTTGTHHHHPHNHYHHQHSSSLASQMNPHHSHHSRQESNHETIASYSDRNSNSLASSRESSASFSMRSQRRKLSVSSHTGGKIPWCGCWGNGCL